MDAIPNQGQSQLWRDVLKGRDILSTGLIMGIGDGSQTSLWYHHWVGVSPIYQLMAVEVPENIAHWRSEWMSFNLSVTKNENWRSVFAIAIWHIWKMRNKAVFDGAMQNSTTIFNQFLSDYYASNKYLQINLVRPIIQDQLQKWRPPQSGFYKLNTDGSWRGIAAAGGGGVIRSEDGGWATGFSASFHARTPLAAELLALKKGLQLAWDHNFKKLEVEVDAKELLNLLNSGLDQPYHDLFVLIHEVSQMLKWDWVVILNHIHRDYNQVAHLLAYLSFYMEQDSKVYQEPPQYVQAAFRKDLGNVTSTSSGNT
ncbi:hypothetical protein RDABS01_006903 [Bienertia sinuspersici]